MHCKTVHDYYVTLSKTFLSKHNKQQYSNNVKVSRNNYFISIDLNIYITLKMSIEMQYQSYIQHNNYKNYTTTL